MVTPKNPKKPLIYSCEKCNFNCSNKKDYNRHLLTAKHKMITNGNINVDNFTPKNPKAFVCDCGKEYNFASGLSRHKKNCQKNSEIPIENTFVQNDNPTTNELMATIIKQNGELSKQNGELARTNIELVEKIHEIIPKIGNTTNNTNCNNTFNVQMFLNNDCKNAMSIQDFIKSIELNMSHLKAITDNGYVDTVSNIMIKALSELEITDRPLHCTDLKRETIYIKDNDEWNKSIAREELTGVIDDIENKQYNLVARYAQENPQASVLDTPENKFQNKALNNALGNSEDHDKLNKKICKEVLPTIKLDKSCIN